MINGQSIRIIHYNIHPGAFRVSVILYHNEIEKPPQSCQNFLKFFIFDNKLINHDEHEKLNNSPN